MATFSKFESFVEALAEGNIDFDDSDIKIALSNTAPTLATDDTFADITEISAGNGYTAGGATLGSKTSSQTSGTYTGDGADVTFTASGGSIGPFRYIIVYDATTGYLMGTLDYGSGLTLNNGDSFEVRWNASGLLTIT